jgi:hypothetical protein
MNKRVLSVAAFVVFVACKPAKPSIYCDISNLAKNDLNNRSFIIRNTGNADLIVEDFVTGCECTSLALKKDVHISSGDSIIVPVAIIPTKSFFDSIKQVYLTIKTNAQPRLTSFSFTYKNPYYRPFN